MLNLLVKLLHKLLNVVYKLLSFLSKHVPPVTLVILLVQAAIFTGFVPDLKLDQAIQEYISEWYQFLPTMVMYTSQMHLYFNMASFLWKGRKWERCVGSSYFLGNARKHKEALSKLNEAPKVGEASLQNALQLALNSLKHLPSHSSREIIVIIGSLTSCDPDNIQSTIQLLKSHSIRCTCIGLAAEVYVCKLLCIQTHGTYSVILDGEHFKDLLMACCMPPPALKEAESNLVKMGFPKHTVTKDSLSLCVCHNTAFTSKSFTESGYFCPQCKAKYCSLPVECKICGLTLVSGPQLARTYQHLFPLMIFDEVQLDKNDSKSCFSCLLHMEKKAYKCGKCAQLFCIDCDLYLHESLQTCPGCSY